MKTTEQYYEMYRDFKGMLLSEFNGKIMHTNSMRADSMRAMCKIADLDRLHAIMFMVYICEYWHAYTMDIINGRFLYIHMTGIVWDSFVEYVKN